MSIGGSYDWIRVLGIRRFQLAARPASGGRLHPGSSPGHLAVGFIPAARFHLAALHLVWGIWQLALSWQPSIWSWASAGSSPSGPGHRAVGSILAALHLVLGICWQLSIWSWASGSYPGPGHLAAALHLVLGIWQLAPSCSSPFGPEHLADIW